MIDLIMKKMEQIDCGWIDNKGNIHKDDDINFSLEYYCKFQMKYYRIKQVYVGTKLNQKEKCLMKIKF